jgi:hypothetical protein
MEQQLQRFVDGAEADELMIIYNDMHGLWGGFTITLSASGAYERLERARGASLPLVRRGTVAPARVHDLVRLLSEIKAWEQHTPERMPVPDESRATLVQHGCCGPAASMYRSGNGSTILPKTLGWGGCVACCSKSQRRISLDQCDILSRQYANLCAARV